MLAPILLLAAQAAPAPPAEPRRVAREVLEQLLAEDDHISHFRDYRGHDRIGIDGRPRGTTTSGVCRKESLAIERDPAPAGGISEIAVTRWFLVLTDAKDLPLWDLHGDALERRCRDVDSYQHRWFIAEGPSEAAAAVRALTALKAALERPEVPPRVWACRTAQHCPDPKAVARLIDPLDPGTVSDGDTAIAACPDDSWCLGVQLQDPGCGAWVTQLRLDRSGDRFRSARALWLAGLLECGEREMLEAER